MDNNITAGVAEGKASARNPSSERSPSVTHIHHYHGPVNSVGTAVNSNLGINYGSIDQTVRSGSTSSPCNVVNHLSSSSTTMSTLPRIQASSFPSLLNPILDASHTRNRTLSPPNSKCFPGTREKVFKKVDSWIDSSLLFGNPHIMWIHGYAGCGKSAIAQVVAESMSSKGRLAASFFFFRGSGSRSTAGRLATTVASQLVASIPVTAPLIKAAIHANPGLLSTSSTSLSAQFQHLVYDPINEVKRDRFVASLRQGTFLIVLDGVDECDDRDEIASFIQHMIEFFEKKPRTPLRFLITSRVENHLYQRLHSSKQVKLLNLVEHTSDTDIAMALDVAISDEKRGLPFACEASWPSRKDRLQLVKHINGSYIFMTTITKLLFDRNNDDRLTPMQRLPLLLAMRPDFDALYHRTLATSQGLPHFRDIVSIVALAESPLSITQIAELLSIETFYVSNVLVNLHSIMQVPGDDRSPVTLWHTSLRDFLTSEERAGPFFAHPAYHLRIAFRCASLSNGGSSTSSSRTSWLEFSKNFAKEHLIKSAEGVEGTECTFNSGVLACITESLNKPWFDGQTALEVACRAKQWKLVRALVNAGADPSTRFQGSADHIVAPLHAACHYKAREVIALLLDKGADLNVVAPLSNSPGSWGWYAFPLAWATGERDIDLVDRLLARGADPNLKGGWYGSALHISAKNGEYDVVRMLLEHGADPDVKDRAGRTPLHITARRGHVNVAECLLEFGADTNIQDKGGETPLHRASVWGMVEVAELLLNHHADSSIRSRKGQTALQRARDANEQGVITMLLRWGITR